ncbi:GNAT family N-acetyltransferase [Pseudoalteromonas sp. H105]|uniref:GNAT family N-acetyltransferase n=1 Tax=Pseudoalteromonas sp. H105 TaxID=1348393 RepID=UPI000731F4D4|nr:GNAT family N-acetyltransferase [Pseudoalteromonas sp. H105]KTF13951.1 tRNA(Met) cytidine acetyltransferase [Pseudoalteromonas sp. H105]
MHDFKQFDTQLNTILTQLAYAKHRQLLVISGEQAWCYLHAQHLNIKFNDAHVTTLSKHSALSRCQWPDHTHQILGQEFDHAIYDGFSGLLPDKLAALSGTIKAGGILVLLLPELANLKSWCDPALINFQSFEQQQPISVFNQRLAILLNGSDICHFSQQHSWRVPHANNPTQGKIDFQEQQYCIEQIVKTARGRANRPLLLSADRGRGKSSALGFAAAQLPDKKIIICAQQFSALHSCFKHLAQQSGLTYNGSEKQLANLSFSAPDQLLLERPTCDVLFVDEAAAIPVPLLKKMLEYYPRIVFSSTVVGYEGNGRGYTLKFKRYLQTHYKNMRSIELKQPIRFAVNDPLEQQVCRLLALDAHYDESPDNDKPFEFKEITPEQLLNDDPLLLQVIGLLSLAHYQNSVNDLRHLLDAASQRLFICFGKNHILAVCLVAIEGGLTPEISHQVAIGKRRPQGHLMAQTLAQLTFDSTILTKNMARVVRIAVAPDKHNQDIGSQLLQFAQAQLSPECDYFGASFGANATLLKFWHNNDFTLVKLGFQKDKATAEYSALVVKPIDTDNILIQTLATQFSADIAFQLLNHYQALDYQLVEVIVSDMKDAPYAKKENERLKACMASDFQMHNIKPLLWRTFWQYPSSLKNCDAHTKYLLIRLILQNWSPEKAHHALLSSGKKSLSKQFKQAVINWYENLSHSNIF